MRGVPKGGAYRDTKIVALGYKGVVPTSAKPDERRATMEESLDHTRWNCKYHIVWAPKYRRKIIYGKYKKEIGAILRKLCEYKHIEIMEANACSDHVHMCLKILPKYSVSSIMGYLKGKSSLMIFEQFSNLKYRYGNRHFWCRGYYVSTVGINEQSIVNYIRDQEKHDKMTDQLSLIEDRDPFKGS